MNRLILALGMMSLVPTFAAADERGTYVTLDRVGTDSDVGLDVSALFYLTNVTDDSQGLDFGLRENFHARYVDPSGFGVFGQFAVGHVFGGTTETAATNVEVGGLYVLKLDGADVSFRFGLGLPTAPRTLNGFLTNAAVGIARFEDLALIAPDTLWLRPGVSIRLGSRELFAQADVGIDVPIKTGDAAASEVLLHGNLGVGTRQGPVALTLEFATYAADTDGLQAVHNLGASVRYAEGNVHPFVSYVLPFQFGESIPAHVVIAGVDGTF